MPDQIKSLGTILGVWAHPDDETFISGGILAQAIKNGQRVVCITATKGEKGSLDESRWPSSKISQIREQEMKNSMKALGVSKHLFLGFIDGECDKEKSDKAVEKISQIMKDVNPDTVLTFGPDGMTGHPDHITVGKWTHQAFNKTLKNNANLYQATTTQEWIEEFVPVINKFQVFAPGFPYPTSPQDIDLDFALPKGIIDKKYQAIIAHHSQVEHMIKTFGEDFLKKMHGEEFFKKVNL